MSLNLRTRARRMISDWENNELLPGWRRHFLRAIGRNSGPYSDSKEKQNYRDVMVSLKRPSNLAKYS